jgi:probable addiction module antidote protein
LAAHPCPTAFHRDFAHIDVGLLALRDIAEAYGGLATVAQKAGVTRETLYRALSPSGNPTLKTLLAVLHAVGMRPSVVPAEHTPARG